MRPGWIWPWMSASYVLVIISRKIFFLNGTQEFTRPQSIASFVRKKPLRPPRLVTRRRHTGDSLKVRPSPTFFATSPLYRGSRQAKPGRCPQRWTFHTRVAWGRVIQKRWHWRQRVWVRWWFGVCGDVAGDNLERAAGGGAGGGAWISTPITVMPVSGIVLFETSLWVPSPY
jgi:hypothetical protein